MVKQSEDIMLFSWTKCSGHAASRFGWALVKDPSVADSMATFIRLTTISPSIESQYRALGIMDYLTSPEGDQFFGYVRETIASYWNELTTLFQGTTTFTIVGEHYSAYLWIKCNDMSDIQCESAFTSRGIMGRAGRVFGAPNYYRINLTIHPKSFTILVTKLKILLNQYK